MAAPHAITREQLRAAWAQRRRAHWPCTFEACMADPFLAGLVRATAHGMAAAQHAAARTLPPIHRQPASPSAAPSPRHRAHTFDPKRLAAGDPHDD